MSGERPCLPKSSVPYSLNLTSSASARAKAFRAKSAFIIFRAWLLAVCISATATLIGTEIAMAQGVNVFQATLGEADQKTPEVSTEQLQRILAEGSAIVLDSRPRAEFVMSHIPGALNAAPRAGAPMSEFIDEVVRLVRGDKTKALVLYCNGLHCQVSRQLSAELLAAGFSNVRRYQLGIPVWRALGGLTEIEEDGINRVLNIDRTAFLVDARTTEEFVQGSLPGALDMSLDIAKAGGLAKAGRGRLQAGDFNTRIIVFGRDGSQARALAEMIVRAGRHNVLYFAGSYETLKSSVKQLFHSQVVGVGIVPQTGNS